MTSFIYDVDGCPFCSPENQDLGILEKSSLLDICRFSVMCSSCGANGPRDLSESGAVEQWNTRSREGALKKKLEQYEGTLYVENINIEHFKRKLDTLESKIEEIRNLIENIINV